MNISTGSNLLRPLWPEQSNAYLKALHELLFYNQCLLKIGQRGGKGVIAARIALALDVERVYLFGPATPFYCEGIPCASDLPDGAVRDRAMVVVHEPFFMPGSFDLYTRFSQHLPTLAIGSSGPEFAADTRWQDVKGHSWATWEINPHVTRESLLATSDGDENLFNRDYGSF